MQRSPACRIFCVDARWFSISIPSLPLPPTPPSSKWLPISPSVSNTVKPAKPLWLERPNGAPLPFLSHSLEKVVLAGTKPQLIDKMTTEDGNSFPDRFSCANLAKCAIRSPQIHRTSPSLLLFSFRRISQPEEINWKGVHGFTASSRDDALHTLAQQYRCTLKGSTSSVSGVLSHVYFALSNFKRVRTKLLSSHFKVKQPIVSSVELMLHLAS
jgi:hypothetical protein